MSHAEIRALCHAEAMKWVDVQRQQFRRLGVMGDWDNPYLTLDPRYEAGILDVLADLLDDGYVFRQLKPIHWCMSDRTALAEAELEYHDETTPSIYVNFPMVSGVPARVDPGGRVERSRLARHDLDDDALDPAGERGDRRPPRPDLRRRSLHSTRLRADRPDDPGGRPGGQGHGAWGRSPTTPRWAGAAAGNSSIRSTAIRSSIGSRRSCWPDT